MNEDARSSPSRRPTPPGYCARENGEGWLAVYVPHWHQVWIHPDLPRKDYNRSVAFEETIHATMSLIRPAQLFPLYLQLRDGLDFPGIERFRDIAEALYVAQYPLGRSRPVDFRHLPHSAYAELGKRIIAIALAAAARADTSLLPSAARRQALFAVATFLSYVIPCEPERGAEILDAVAGFGARLGWKTPHEVFERLFACSIRRLNDAKSPRLFSVARPAEIHRNVFEMLRIVALAIKTPPSRLIPCAPAVLGLLTFGLATIRPVIYIRRRGKKVLAGVEVCNEPSGERHVRDVLESQPQPKPDANCRAYRFYADYVALLSKCDAPYELPLGRLQMCQPLLKGLPDLIDKHLIRSSYSDDRSCPYCRIVFNEKETLDAAATCLRDLPGNGMGIARSFSLYQRWLANDCLRTVEQYLGFRTPIELVHVCRPVFGPLTGESPGRYV